MQGEFNFVGAGTSGQPRVFYSSHVMLNVLEAKLIGRKRWLCAGGALVLAAYLVAGTRSASGQVSVLRPDSLVRSGQLENGLRYFVRSNARPQARAELRLVLDAGSVLEREDQLGLAHFAEHMAFNGTERFPKHEIVNYLERIGMRFGADLNAYTSFDETVYTLTVPTDSAGLLETGFDILEDWAFGIQFDSVEIERERGVVLEEWRSGRGAQARVFDEQFPILFHGSRYAERLPIGDPTVLESFNHQSLRDFYHDWYRPDLMAVVAVGDFDPDSVVRFIQEKFGPYARRADLPERMEYDVPPVGRPLAAVTTDPELTTTDVGLYYRLPVVRAVDLPSYRDAVTGRLYSNMLNARLYELGEQPDAPFLFASTGRGGLVRTVDAYVLSASVKTGKMVATVETLSREVERVTRHGFTEGELERARARVIRNMERRFDERETTPSTQYAAQLVSGFLNQTPLLDIGWELRAYQQLLSDITLDEIDQKAKEWTPAEERVVLVRAPESDRTQLPSLTDISGILESVVAREIAPYEDDATLALIVSPPPSGRVTSETYHQSVGVHDWELSNGVRVLLKPTDFEADQIRFTAQSPGGTSLVPDEDYVAAITAVSIASESGIGELSNVDLQKVLAGKAVDVFPELYETGEGLTGFGSPKDLEPLFQLTHLFFTQPRFSQGAFLTFKQRLQESVKNRNAEPTVAFQDTLSAVLTNSHFRRRPYTEEVFDEMDLARSRRIYEDRFADASDFTFVFVGAFTVDSMRPYIETYLGSLPSTQRIEQWRDIGVRPPTGVIRKVVRRGLEPQGLTSLVFSGLTEYDRHEHMALVIMGQVLDIRLREVLREDLGGTYGAGVSANLTRIPVGRFDVLVRFGSDPNRVDELVSAAFAEIEGLKTGGPSLDDVNKAKEILKRSRETAVRENQFWLQSLQQSVLYDRQFETILEYESLVDSVSLDDIRRAAIRFLDLENYVQVTLLPEANGI